MKNFEPAPNVMSPTKKLKSGSSKIFYWSYKTFCIFRGFEQLSS